MGLPLIDGTVETCTVKKHTFRFYCKKSFVITSEGSTVKITSSDSNLFQQLKAKTTATQNNNNNKKQENKTKIPRNFMPFSFLYWTICILLCRSSVYTPSPCFFIPFSIFKELRQRKKFKEKKEGGKKKTSWRQMTYFYIGFFL